MNSIYQSLDALNQLSPIPISAISGTILAIGLAIITFGMAISLKLSYFKEVFRKPKALLVGLLLQLVLFPGLTLLLVVAGEQYITPQVALGMILVAACPVGNTSNFLTFLSHGRTELSITLTAISGLLSLVATPLSFSLMGGWYFQLTQHTPEQQGLLHGIAINPMNIFTTIFVLVVLPLVLGMLVSYFFPRLSGKTARHVRIWGIMLLFFCVVTALLSNVQAFTNRLEMIFFIVFVHNALALLLGYLVALAFKLTPSKRRAITIDTGIHNSSLALSILFNPAAFPTPVLAMQLTAAWWGVWHILSGVTLSMFWWVNKPKK